MSICVSCDYHYPDGILTPCQYCEETFCDACLANGICEDCIKEAKESYEQE